MQTTCKQNIIVVANIKDDKSFLLKLAKELGVVEPSRIKQFVNALFAIILSNKDNVVNEDFWYFLEDLIGDDLEMYDLNSIEIVLELTLGSVHETLVTATGIAQDYTVINVDHDVGYFLVAK